MLVKSCPVSIKAVGTGDEAGTFEAIVSVFGNVDSYGDVVLPGAFTETLAEWKDSGNPIPVFWSHRMDDPDYLIGEVLEAAEVEARDGYPAGLWVKGRIDLDDVAPTSKAPQVHRLLKRRRVTQFSFAYDVRDAAPVEVDGVEAWGLSRLKLYEVGPTPIGANQETDLLGVKSAELMARGLALGVKEGRVLAAKHMDSLRGARDAIDAVLAAAENDREKDGGKASGNDEGPGGVKSEDRDPRATLTTLAAQLSIDALD